MTFTRRELGESSARVTLSAFAKSYQVVEMIGESEMARAGESGESDWVKSLKSLRRRWRE